MDYVDGVEDQEDEQWCQRLLWTVDDDDVQVLFYFLISYSYQEHSFTGLLRYAHVRLILIFWVFEIYFLSFFNKDG